MGAEKIEKEGIKSNDIPKGLNSVRENSFGRMESTESRFNF